MGKRIIYPTDDGGVVIITPIENSGRTLDEIIAKSVPARKPYKIIDFSDVPSDHTFRNAWEYDGLRTNMEKAKQIAHEIRRELRDEEFKPYDDAIAKQIPGKMEIAEAERKKIREKYAAIQVKIDEAANEQDLKSALGI